MAVAGGVLIRRGARRGLILSRILIISLLIAALSGPYNPVPVTVTDDTPSITVLSDETYSMELYTRGTGQEVFDYLREQTPVRFERMGGSRSDIGDEILALSGGHVVVVSDGNNNFGRDLSETIDFVSDTGTHVYAVSQIPEKNDLSVEITGARTAVMGNENLVGIVVRQALSDAEYALTIYVDGEPTYSDTITQAGRIKTISFSNTFYELGAHQITAQISSQEDTRALNNVYTKTIYVVPRPRVLLISKDQDSPLIQILKRNYQVTTSAELTGNFSAYKAVVIDNINEGRLDQSTVDRIREYTANGGGLVVVGGDNSYDKGDYLNSSFETILPVESFASTYKGNVNVVMVLDTSGSVTRLYDVSFENGDESKPQKENILQYEKAIALDLLDQMGRDTNVGLVVFGKESGNLTDGLLPLSIKANRELLQANITNLVSVGADYTSYEKGLEMAENLLADTTGEKNVVIISDGGFSGNEPDIQLTYDLTRSKAAAMVDKGIRIFFVQIITNDSISYRCDRGVCNSYFELLSAETGGEYKPVLKGQGLDLKFGRETADIPPGDADSFALVRLDEDHFITRYLNISGSVSGFNDVTQKVGAQRLITTSLGKPIVTSWEFGLGRVVSLSTDNGKQWGGALYSGENARLLPSIINWVVGDPRPDDGITVYSGDIYLGSPRTIMVRSSFRPTLTFNGEDVSLIPTGEGTYEGILDPLSPGVFPLVISTPSTTVEDVIAVNYPLEYRDVGNNPEFLDAVRRNRGEEVYSTEQVRSLLLNDIKENSTRTVVEKDSIAWLFLLAALLIFLVEVVIRRARGIISIKLKRKGEPD